MVHNCAGIKEANEVAARRRDIEFRLGGRAPLAGKMDEMSSQGTWFRFGGALDAYIATMQDLPLSLWPPDFGEKKRVFPSAKSMGAVT